MTDCELKDISLEDIEFLLLEVEKSFNIKFEANEMIGLSSFGELCDHISNKIKLNHSDNCTTQQAFYKLRNAISLTLHVHNVKPDSLLADIFPRKNRISSVRRLENNLGFKLSFLRRKHFISGIFIILLLASLIGLYNNWKVGLSGFLISIACLRISKKIGKEMDIRTAGELAEKITRENYLKSRRNPKTFNKNEIENILEEWFSKAFDLDKKKLTRSAKFR